jgi:hypothetical protein
MTVNLAEALSDYLTLRRAMGFSLTRVGQLLSGYVAWLVTCTDSPVSSATSRSIPTPACDTTPWPSAETFTRETTAVLFTCEVPSSQRHGTVEKSQYALQDRHFRLSTHHHRTAA